MSLKVSTSQSRIVERIDILIGPLTFGLVEGSVPEAPHTLGLKKQDFFDDLESITLDEIEQLANEMLAYAARVRKNTEAARTQEVQQAALSRT